MHTVNKRLLWQHLIRMVIDKICKMTFEGVKSKSESFFSISDGVLELWRKTLGGFHPPGPDRVKSPKDTIPIDELVEENFEGSCILRLCHAYLGSTKSITLSVEEILVKKMDITESYFDDLSDESDSEED